MTPDWTLLQLFVIASELGSLTQAAERLAISQPTASRGIRRLETELGIALFLRHSRGLRLTAEGVQLFEKLRGVSDDVGNILRQARGLTHSLEGSVRLSVNEPVAVHVLGPCYAALREKYPQIALEIAVDNRIANLSRRDADIAVRMLRPKQMGLVVKRAGQVELGLYAHKRYLKKHGTPQSFEASPAHTWIGMDADPSWPKALRTLGLKHEHFSFRTDSLLAQVAAVESGVGIGGMHCRIARKNPALVRVLEELPLPPLELWLVMHEDVRRNPAVHAVFDQVFDYLADYAAG